MQLGTDPFWDSLTKPTVINGTIKRVLDDSISVVKYPQEALALLWIFIGINLPKNTYYVIEKSLFESDKSVGIKLVISF